MNFVSFDNANSIVEAIANKFKTLGGAYTPRGSVSFANLPTTLTKAMTGYVYNMSDGFTTDTRFVEGAGKKYSEGTNVVVADVSTTAYNAVTPTGTENPSSEGWYEENSGAYAATADTTVDSGKTYYEAVVTPSFKFDVIGNFIDTDGIEAAIQNVSDMIAGEFDSTAAYAAGDVVVHEGKLYKYKAAHTAGNFDNTEVDEKTVAELIGEAEPESLTTAQVSALLALLD